jgi:hypothetical protein
MAAVDAAAASISTNACLLRFNIALTATHP